jgi:hypothetical protein
MQDWEVLAMNERSLRETLTEKEGELKEQVAALKEAYEKAASERDMNSQAVDGLQRALQEVQNGRSTPSHSKRLCSQTAQHGKLNGES